jgi:hypothetical protein
LQSTLQLQTSTHSFENPIGQCQGGYRTHTITPEAGHALEKLGHAIDYLTDEFIHESGSPQIDRGRIDAIQLLIDRNRQIYFSCPVTQTFGEKIRAWSNRFLLLHH